MKRIFSVLIAFLLACSVLTSCGSTGTAEAEIVEAEEAKAIEGVQTETVEITLDNYLDYYEWDEEAEVDQIDGQGVPAYTAVSSYLVLKEQYAAVYDDSSVVEVGYTYEEKEYQTDEDANFAFDPETETAPDFSDWTPVNTETYDESSEGSGQIYICFSLYADYAAVVSDIQIVRVEGQLVLKK